jgi:hypothetical protein
LWQDSTVFQDSFFAPDARDGFSNSEFPPLAGARPLRPAPRRPEPSMFGNPDDLPDPLTGLDTDEIGGVVVDSPKFSSGSRR